jgi:RimJ/RimL family protein N-acetyltransferase
MRALTDATNAPSQRVLLRAGFAQVERVETAEGSEWVWRRDLSPVA